MSSLHSSWVFISLLGLKPNTVIYVDARGGPSSATQRSQGSPCMSRAPLFLSSCVWAASPQPGTPTGSQLTCVFPAPALEPASSLKSPWLLLLASSVWDGADEGHEFMGVNVQGVLIKAPPYPPAQEEAARRLRTRSCVLTRHPICQPLGLGLPRTLELCLVTAV